MPTERLRGSCWFQNRVYNPIIPCSDNDDIASEGDRLMLRHSRWEEPILFIAPKDNLHSGFVIGIFED